MRSLPLTLLLLGFLFLSPLNTLAGDDVPSWLRQASSQAVPGYGKDVPAVSLRQEQLLTVGSDGRIVNTENHAIKVLSREGSEYAFATAFYLVSSGKVRNFTAWLIRPDGTTKQYDKKLIVDIASDPDDVYNEYRIKVIDAKADVEVGSVFGYTVESEETPLFYQDSFAFQSSIPTLVSRYTLALPSGWSATSKTFNAPDLAPAVNGTTYVWEMRALDRIPDEPLSPSAANLSPRIVVNYSPAASASKDVHTFDTWVDVSRWATRLYDPQVVVDDNVAIKARDLTANAKTEIEKIRAIGNFVQNLQYISIDIGVAYGNGYIPRSSALVLARGYGDCKDKANLMRALLRAVKIDSYPVVVYSGDPTFVRKQWASPKQFNHCIIAVKVSDGTDTATVFKDEKLGRLLIFDATDPYTPVGDLPSYLQGSNALIIAGDSGGLVELPVTPDEFDGFNRDVKATISESGEIKGRIEERASGQASAMFRREVRGMSATDYRKAIEGWLTRSIPSAKLVDLKSNDRQSESKFDLDVEFASSQYGQLMQNRLLVFKPVLVGRRNSVVLSELKRINPIELPSSSMTETATFTLPKGFVVDETPDAVKLDTKFGKYSADYKTEGDTIVFKRSLSFKKGVVSPGEYASVKSFFDKMMQAEQAPVVLIRK